MLNISKAEKEFGFKAKTKFEEGLRRQLSGIFLLSKPKKREKLNKPERPIYKTNECYISRPDPKPVTLIK